MRTLTIRRVTTWVADGTTDIREETLTFATRTNHGWWETAARQAAQELELRGMRVSGDSFAHPDGSYLHPYEDAYVQVTGHLSGEWTGTERRAIIRMVDCLGR